MLVKREALCYHSMASASGKQQACGIEHAGEKDHGGRLENTAHDKASG